MLRLLRAAALCRFTTGQINTRISKPYAVCAVFGQRPSKCMRFDSVRGNGHYCSWKLVFVTGSKVKPVIHLLDSTAKLGVSDPGERPLPDLNVER